MTMLRRMSRGAVALATRAWRGASADLTFLLAKGDTGSCITSVLVGLAPLTGRVCIFVHYDRSGTLRAHTRRYLDALIAEGLCIVLVSNSPLSAESRAYLMERCASIIFRTNRGYDFGAFRDGILSLEMSSARLTQLVLANDSVYGPMVPLESLFASMDFSIADIWGVTDSWQTRYHLQSYLMVFGPVALNSPKFAEFWKNVRNVRSKWAVVRHYEIGMTRTMQMAGLRCAAVFDYQALIRHAEAILDAAAVADAAEEPRQPHHAIDTMLRHAAQRATHGARMRQATNPVIDLWLLLADAGGPLIKRELLRDDPTYLPDLAAWHRVVKGRAPALYADIMEDLKRVMRRSAP